MFREALGHKIQPVVRQSSSGLLLVLVAFATQACDAQDRSAGQETANSGLTGKLMVGYQGWFNCEGDGAKLGWRHWTKDRRHTLASGNLTIDLWPDISELGEKQLYPTDLRFEDGRVAKVFSSADPETTALHFRWMQQYGIDGAFLQRFAVGLKNPLIEQNHNRVLQNVREAAVKSGRLYALMYDLSGLRKGQVATVRQDWMRLHRDWNIGNDAHYLRHRGRPLVAVWGIGFSDERDYSLKECYDLIVWLKSAGFSVMLGVPSYWREGTRDAVKDPLLHEIIRMADVASPWTIGRYRNPQEARRHGRQVWQLDRDWCRQANVDFLPVVFPGFSWHNLHGGKLNQIPRLGGDFFWSQVLAAREAGCDMLYVAMFDEVDEGTAIFKCSNQVPKGEGVELLTYENLPSDHYLKLAGEAAKLMRDGKSRKDKQ